ncbi:sensor domain-containing diguanylate cyclase [Photobacterium sp. TY1-4]|uniref:sensor domain-containing diguanylate cyclase n=1 Tax=Photobacterium sp. TY1-4 TaxID=2899122 RepID=UPI0021BFC557|nr:sensor domain-containing diguanylate cyclase [Photobacterium sp. TY1-4]UXI02021.1 sensor domain-containing diguanylate cyclase [Photobacterium sp. TY1-4]
MAQSPTLKVDLRKLILLLTVVSVFVTMSNSFYSIYKVQRDLLIKKTMESNQVYARKMAETTDTFIESAQEQLAFSAHRLSSLMQDESQLMAETDRLRRQTKTFNSVVIVNATGKIVAVSPETLQIKGIRLSTENSMQSLQAKRPLVTDPFVSPAGNYLISISHPIFSVQGKYLGYISGSIYLEKKNILSDVLGKHSYQDGSYLYVVDRNKTLIYHPEQSRIGEVIDNNDAINYVLSGNQGSMNMMNSLGIDMLAGFSPVERTGWGIVAQRPKVSTLSELDEQMMAVFVTTIPVGLLTLAGIWISAIFISRPLWQLAREVKTLDHSDTVEHIQDIRSWYFEAAQLKAAITKCLDMMARKISQLDADSHTDPLTNLFNRRGMLKALDAFSDNHQAFSVMALDIDRFKQVNDTYGHDVGDRVIATVAELMRSHARQGDVLCRSGGEEFLIFLTDTDLEHTFKVAERLREAISAYEIPSVGKITVSIGIAHCTGEHAHVHDSIKRADSALYAAKSNGRNRTVRSDEKLLV